MGDFGFSASDALNTATAKIKDPFNRYFATPLDMKSGLERNDFKDGFIITPYNRDGKKLNANIVKLRADMMPIVPFTFGGTMKLVKDYYPGNSEPTVQVLGPQETDISINGRMKSKHFAAQKDQTANENTRQIPIQIQQSIELIRLNGFLVQIQMGSFARWGFIENAMFDLHTLADVYYKIQFLIVGFNKPKDYIIVSKTASIPYDVNKNLSDQLANYQATFGTVPPTMPKSLADQISQNINGVAKAVNLVTGFVSNVLNEVDSIKDAVARAQGLIANARNTITTLQRRIGAISTFGGVSTNTGNGISGGYKNASYLAGSLSGAFSLSAFLAALALQLKNYIDTQPLQRHLVVTGDTLQKIAMKYYQDSSKWNLIYDHNKLQSTLLVIGSVLEIPNV